jgi:hypothetical protein
MKRLQKSVAVIATLLMSSSTLGNVALADTVPISKSGSATMSLQVPSNASKVYENDKNHVKYQVNDAVQVQDNSGDTLVAPETVDSQITSSDGSSSSGTTTTTVDLSQAQSKSSSSVNTLGALSPLFGFFEGVHVFADTQYNQAKKVGYDSTYGVRLSLTVNWQITNTYYYNITSVSGGYTLEDYSIHIVNSNVNVLQGTIYSSQRKNQQEYTRSAWSFNTGFSKIYNQVTQRYVTYTVNINRGKSTWSAPLSISPW